MREQFLLDPDLVFLNHGSFGACPRAVLDACHALQMEMERNPVAFLARESGARLAAARAALGAYLGAQKEDLVFVPNATHGVNTVARSLDLKPGDEVLGTDHEYGACDAAWESVCARAGATYRRVEIPLPFEAGEFTERIWTQVSPRTRVLYLSHLTSTTALRFPIEDLIRKARARGILTLIDGAHAPGQIDLDLDALGADFYTGNCHKWLCAPKGAAFLHVRREHHRSLDPLAISWGHHPAPGNETYTGFEALERHHQWQGTRDLSAFLSVPAALEFQARHDWPSQRKRCHALAAEALRRISRWSGLAPVCRDDDFVQMVVIPVPERDAAELKALLYDAHRIEIPVTRHRDRLFVRISIQAYNTECDIEALDAALRAIYGA